MYAYDFNLYNNLRLHDLNKAASGPFGPGVLGYLPDAGMPKFNLTTAKAKVAAYKTGDRSGPQVHAQHPERLRVAAERRGRRRHDAEGRASR